MLTTLYYSLVHSCLFYWTLTLSCKSNTDIKGKKAICIITHNNYTTPINPLVESLQSHFILTMSHCSSGLPVCFPSQGTQVQFPRGYLCETKILLLALSRYTLFKQFKKILPFPALVKFLQLKLMHSVVYNYCQPSLSNIWITIDQREMNHELGNANQYVSSFLKNVLLYSFKPSGALPSENKKNKASFKRSSKGN
jgi:hypothetical protein